MHLKLTRKLVEQVRQRTNEGDCPSNPALSVETLESLVDSLASQLETKDVAWRPIESAPKDGTHILVCDARKPFEGYWTFNQRPPTVAHYWLDADNQDFGFYTSVNEIEQDKPLFGLTHWMPLPLPPAHQPAPDAEGE